MCLCSGAWATLPDGGAELRVRDTIDTDWHPIVRWGSEDALGSSPVSFTLDGRALYLLDSRDANAARLMRLDLATGGTEEIAGDPQYDVSGVVIDPESRTLQYKRIVTND